VRPRDLPLIYRHKRRSFPAVIALTPLGSVYRYRAAARGYA